jgi:Ser-Thr-rich glycosyl-phosphatidyl-inositol-anchored membrane family protein
MKKLYFLGLGLILFSLQLNAQSITNVQASLSGKMVIISYDLTTPEDGQKFDVEIKSSNDGFATKLVEVTGDVGSNQSAGNGKKITWDARKELGAFVGDISFEITATVTFTPLKFVQPSVGSGIKIGKPYTIEWKGGALDRNLKLELLKNDRQVMDIGNIDNSGSYTWNVPKTMEKGDQFKFKLLDPTQPDDAIMSAQFKLKKMSMLVYVGAGVAVVGIAAAVLLGGGDGGVDCTANPTDPACTGGTTTGNELASPPAPPPGGGN